MLERGFHMSDIGTARLTWCELRSFIAHLPPDGSSAYFRARYPNSWWWKPEFGFYATTAQAVQGANWQRAGSKGNPPEIVTRPKEDFELERAAVESDAVPLEDIRAVLAARKRPADPGFGGG